VLRNNAAKITAFFAQMGKKTFRNYEKPTAIQGTCITRVWCAAWSLTTYKLLLINLFYRCIGESKVLLEPLPGAVSVRVKQVASISAVLHSLALTARPPSDQSKAVNTEVRGCRTHASKPLTPFYSCSCSCKATIARFNFNSRNQY
jgi:hypothetical protein